MELKKLTEDLTVSPQINAGDIPAVVAAGFKSIIVNRPDGESADQPPFSDIERAAKTAGLAVTHIPVVAGSITDGHVVAFGRSLAALPKPALAFCRTGTRSATLWSLTQAGQRPTSDIMARTKEAGYDLSGLVSRIDGAARARKSTSRASHTVVIVGGGAAGIAVAASLLKRRGDLDIAIIEPAETHSYQPGWTFVGAGIFSSEETIKPMAEVMPRQVTWIKAGAANFEPNANTVTLNDGRVIAYKWLIVCPGLKLHWDAVKGLSESLGKNGVTSNYRSDLAPYTWELVQKLQSGRALFTQPAMPIKCAGAPQKAMYLSADYWLRHKRLKKIDVAFYNAGNVLFGVAAYVPALMEYVKRYDATLNFGHNLVAIDGPAKKAWFETAESDGKKRTIETAFDFFHVCPPQVPQDFMQGSAIADAGGWVDVDPQTLRHKVYSNIYGLGDATNTPNSKTAAATRKQAPVVAANLLRDMGYGGNQVAYDGYGSCPLTVERGKIVLAEFLYGGAVCSSFPNFIIDGTKPSRLAWQLKQRILPPLYWRAMLKGREWLAKPKVMS